MPSDQTMPLSDQSGLLEIFQIVKRLRNLDFSGYRPALLERRVMVRVRATKSDNIFGYVKYLKSTPSEIDLLLDVLTINVTEFFRDEGVFDSIEKKLLAEIIERKQLSKSKSIKIWSAACASGEETYSLLMCLSEVLGTAIARWNVEIIGTDIDARAISAAKSGVYSSQSFHRLSERHSKLLDKYFYRLDDGRIWIREEWSGLVKFDYLDVIADIMPSNCDLVLCRNMLMYIDHKTQEQIISRIFDSISDYGFLILGAVESILGKNRAVFEEYDKSLRIYVKR